MKYIIFTVDTESDNQWDICSDQTTNNSRFIPRFQDMCEKYGVLPDYLVDYSMANDSWLGDYLKKKSYENKCEIGMHLHAWDTPPQYKYDYSTEHRPYLTEYPLEVMEAKICTLKNLLMNVFEQNIVVHRAGRWATDETYFGLLSKYEFLVDCSVTPGIDWRKQKGAINGGSDYKKEKTIPYIIKGTRILEIPMSVKRIHSFRWDGTLGYTNNIKRCIKSIVGNTLWLRPALFGKEDILGLCRILENAGYKYLEFMIHSSELMPNGSPYIKTQEELDQLYHKIDFIFDYLYKKGYVGVTLSEYRNIFIEEMGNEKQSILREE